MLKFKIEKEAPKMHPDKTYSEYLGKSPTQMILRTPIHPIMRFGIFMH